jgi:DNA modification methylase
MGTGTSNVAAAQWGRHSIGIEVDKKYCDPAVRRLETESRQLFGNITVDVHEG